MQLCHILTQWMYSGGLTECINVAAMKKKAKTIIFIMFYQDVISKMLMTNSDEMNPVWILCTSVKLRSYHRDLSKGVKSNSSQTPVLYSSKSTFFAFSSQIPTNSVNLTKFLPFPYMRNIKYLRGILSSHENYHIPTMKNGKTTEILSSLLRDSHQILWGIFVQVDIQSDKQQHFFLVSDMQF